MGLDDLGKLAVSNYKKWFMSINDKYDTYINDAMESMGDPFKYNNVSNTSRKSSINRLTDFLNDIQEYKESSIKRINSVFEKAQQTDGDIIDEIRPIYQQALDKINTNIENVSIYEQQLTGLKNVEKYKKGTKAFNRSFNNVRGEDLVRQEIEIERIWDKDRDAQRRLYEDVNKRYTQTYHPEIGNRNYYSERNSSFLDDYALKRYEDLKQMAPGMIITEQSYDWETDIDRAHELALRENNQFDFVRQSEERARRRVNNNTTRNQVNNNSTTAQSQVNTAQKKRRKSYADRRTKPINSEFNTTYYGQYNSQTRGYEYVDYKSHYSGGVSRSNYDIEWIEEKAFGEAHSNSEYGIEAPWSTNRTRNTNVPDVPNTNTNTNTNRTNNIDIPDEPHYTNYGPRISTETKPEIPDVNKMPLVYNNMSSSPTASPMIKNFDPNIRMDLDPPSKLGKFGKLDMLMTGINVLGTVSDYKRYRREGKGVVSSAVRSGANFAIGEALGLWALPVALVSSLPGAAIKGADMLYKENRRMNSAANFQVFGGAQFMDTQQLATMRQSGMEMAKMAQYNLQQTLMGNEATYLHR